MPNTPLGIPGRRGGAIWLTDDVLALLLSRSRPHESWATTLKRILLAAEAHATECYKWKILYTGVTDNVEVTT